VTGRTSSEAGTGTLDMVMRGTATVTSGRLSRTRTHSARRALPFLTRSRSSTNDDLCGRSCSRFKAARWRGIRGHWRLCSSSLVRRALPLPPTRLPVRLATVRGPWLQARIPRRDPLLLLLPSLPCLPQRTVPLGSWPALHLAGSATLARDGHTVGTAPDVRGCRDTEATAHYE
jgi:hypothetical protein